MGPKSMFSCVFCGSFLFAKCVTGSFMFLQILPWSCKVNALNVLLIDRLEKKMTHLVCDCIYTNMYMFLS